jgi:hypothetical protein
VETEEIEEIEATVLNNHNSKIPREEATDKEDPTMETRDIKTTESTKTIYLARDIRIEEAIILITDKETTAEEDTEDAAGEDLEATTIITATTTDNPDRDRKASNRDTGETETITTMETDSSTTIETETKDTTIIRIIK